MTDLRFACPLVVIAGAGLGCGLAGMVVPPAGLVGGGVR